MKVIDSLEKQIYLVNEKINKPTAIYWCDDNDNIDLSRPVTLKTLYISLKRIFENSQDLQKQNLKNSENLYQESKKPFVNGHRKSLFTEKQKQEIVNSYVHDNISKMELARRYKCSEKTIRNVIKNYKL